MGLEEMVAGYSTGLTMEMAACHASVSSTGAPIWGRVPGSGFGMDPTAYFLFIDNPAIDGAGRSGVVVAFN